MSVPKDKLHGSGYRVAYLTNKYVVGIEITQSVCW